MGDNNTFREDENDSKCLARRKYASQGSCYYGIEFNLAEDSTAGAV